jgi:hypothetical protein
MLYHQLDQTVRYSRSVYSLLDSTGEVYGHAVKISPKLFVAELADLTRHRASTMEELKSTLADYLRFVGQRFVRLQSVNEISIRFRIDARRMG